MVINVCWQWGCLESIGSSKCISNLMHKTWWLLCRWTCTDFIDAPTLRHAWLFLDRCSNFADWRQGAAFSSLNIAISGEAIRKSYYLFVTLSEQATVRIDCQFLLIHQVDAFAFASVWYKIAAKWILSTSTL